MSAQQNFCHFAKRAARLRAGQWQLNVFQTAYRATIDAEKMGMAMHRLAKDRFKPPDVITKFGSPQQSGCLAYAVRLHVPMHSNARPRWRAVSLLFMSRLSHRTKSSLPLAVRPHHFVTQRKVPIVTFVR